MMKLVAMCKKTGKYGDIVFKAGRSYGVSEENKKYYLFNGIDISNDDNFILVYKIPDNEIPTLVKIKLGKDVKHSDAVDFLRSDIDEYLEAFDQKEKNNILTDVVNDRIEDFDFENYSRVTKSLNISDKGYLSSLDDYKNGYETKKEIHSSTEDEEIEPMDIVSLQDEYEYQYGCGTMVVESIELGCARVVTINSNPTMIWIPLNMLNVMVKNTDSYNIKIYNMYKNDFLDNIDKDFDDVESKYYEDLKDAIAFLKFPEYYNEDSNDDFSCGVHESAKAVINARESIKFILSKKCQAILGKQFKSLMTKIISTNEYIEFVSKFSARCILQDKSILEILAEISDMIHGTKIEKYKMQFYMVFIQTMGFVKDVISICEREIKR